MTIDDLKTALIACYNHEIPLLLGRSITCRELRAMGLLKHGVWALTEAGYRYVEGIKPPMEFGGDVCGEGLLLGVERTFCTASPTRRNWWPT